METQGRENGDENVNEGLVQHDEENMNEGLAQHDDENMNEGLAQHDDENMNEGLVQHDEENMNEGLAQHDDENMNEGLAQHSKAGLRPGDVTWIKLRGASWWPSQVVEENAVSARAKPLKRKSGQILVRLYGTCEYSYVDPVGRQTEFENVLRKHNGNRREIFKKALKQELQEVQSPKSKKRRAKVTGESKAMKEKATPAKAATTGKQDEVISPGTSGSSRRRLKVMKGLGLAAPSGSPFRTN